jgi:hypothetical protein
MPILNPRQRVQWDPNQYSSVEFAFAKAGGQGRVSVQQGDSPMSLSVPGSFNLRKSQGGSLTNGSTAQVDYTLKA